MQRRIAPATRGALLVAIVVAAAAGCAGMRTGPDCPDIGGTFTNGAEGSGVRLSEFLLPDRPAAGGASSVSLAEDAEQQGLLVVAGAQRATLLRGSDFVCDAHGLRLVKPSRSGIDLGEMLVHQVDTFHTFGRAPDGALTASLSTKERATIAGVPLAGPEHPGTSYRWRPVAAGAHR